MNVCFSFSLRQGSAPKPTVGGTSVAIAAMAPYPGRLETRLHPEPRGARSVDTPALRSPMCEVIRVRQTPDISFIYCRSWTFVIHVHQNTFFAFYGADCTLTCFLLQVSWFKENRTNLIVDRWYFIVFEGNQISPHCQNEETKDSSLMNIFVFVVNDSLWPRTWPANLLQLTNCFSERNEICTSRFVLYRVLDGKVLHISLVWFSSLSIAVACDANVAKKKTINKEDLNCIWVIVCLSRFFFHLAHLHCGV